MPISIPTYSEAISELYPTVSTQSTGGGNIYENIQHIGGDPIPSKEQLDADIVTISKDRVWRAIQASRDARADGGVKVGNNWFHSDEPSRIKQIALVMFGANMPPGIMWKTMQGIFVAMNPTLAMQIFQSIAAQDQTIFGRAEQHRAASAASAFPTEYDFTTGWPQTYEEWVAEQPPPV